MAVSNKGAASSPCLLSLQVHSFATDNAKQSSEADQIQTEGVAFASTMPPASAARHGNLTMNFLFLLICPFLWSIISFASACSLSSNRQAVVFSTTYGVSVSAFRRTVFCCCLLLHTPFHREKEDASRAAQPGLASAPC